MSGVLRPGALVWHPEHGAGRFREHDHLVPTAGRVDIVIPLGPDAPQWCDFADGWVLVGETGFAPEGARLVWMTDERVVLYRAVHARERKLGSRLEYDAAEFVRLNPEQGDT